LRVKPGQVVRAGQPIGRPGLSGETEFPHLHFEVRHRGQVVDPFAPLAPVAGGCGGGAPLWDGPTASAAAYKLRTILNFGFVSQPITASDVESGRAAEITPNAGAGDLIAYVRALGLQAGDVQRMVLTGPHGSVLFNQSTPALDHAKAQFFQMFGVRRSPGGWRKGPYTAVYSVVHGNKTVLAKRFAIVM
jgi:murein DD-endopeptidase MepM/ murein hydrolase activator NlpD